MADDPYLSLTPRERLELLDAASQQRGLAPAILEKDYWVCKTLSALFALPELGRHLVFKGGTSLSKVYGLIDRFSEDVDVSFHREFLGFGEDHDPEAATGKEQTRRIEALHLQSTTAYRRRAGDPSRPGNPHPPPHLMFSTTPATLNSPRFEKWLLFENVPGVFLPFPEPLLTRKIYRTESGQLAESLRERWPPKLKR